MMLQGSGDRRQIDGCIPRERRLVQWVAAEGRMEQCVRSARL